MSPCRNQFNTMLRLQLQGQLEVLPDNSWIKNYVSKLWNLEDC